MHNSTNMSRFAAGQPLTLKSGRTLKNRLVKSAMAEYSAAKDGLPNPAIHPAYNAWAEGGWGLVITGNVEVDVKYLGGAGDIAFNDSIKYEEQLKAWKAWAEANSNKDTPTIVQLNHPGRQSPYGAGTRSFFEKNLAPSAISPNLGTGFIPRTINSFLFGTPKEMTTEDIDGVVRRFAATAHLASEAGFAGVELHAAHGYLLTQFLSEDTNKRTDGYGGSPAARTKIVLGIIKAIRAATPRDFIIGIKFNSVDQSSAELPHLVEQLKLIADAGVDFLEVSGGTMENPTMTFGVSEKDEKSTRTKAREAFFLDFAKAIRHDLPDVPLMVTGGFRSRRGVENAISGGDCDIVGLGRPAVMNPAFAKTVLLNSDIEDGDAIIEVPKAQSPRLSKFLGIKAVGAGAESTWYSSRIRSIEKF